MGKEKIHGKAKNLNHTFMLDKKEEKRKKREERRELKRTNDETSQVEPEITSTKPLAGEPIIIMHGGREIEL